MVRKIKEETIVLITCFSKKFKKYKKYKNNLFVSTSENEFSYCYDGKNYGFDFDVTESEVNSIGATIIIYTESLARILYISKIFMFI